MPKTLVLEENHMTNKQLKQTLMTQETMNIISLIWLSGDTCQSSQSQRSTQKTNKIEFPLRGADPPDELNQRPRSTTASVQWNGPHTHTNLILPRSLTLKQEGEKKSSTYTCLPLIWMKVWTETKNIQTLKEVIMEKKEVGWMSHSSISAWHGGLSQVAWLPFTAVSFYTGLNLVLWG